jgi:hypothetical protein
VVNFLSGFFFGGWVVGVVVLVFAWASKYKKSEIKVLSGKFFASIKTIPFLQNLDYSVNTELFI